MGREVRRVPPNWEHPKKPCGNYQPMFDETATEGFNEWLEDYQEFIKSELPEMADEHEYDISDPFSAFCDWDGGPPDAQYYRPHWGESKATWYQVYETVSEGTPVTPPFETQEELIDYLAKNGDFWDQKRQKQGRVDCGPWPLDRAERFVKGTQWAPSFAIIGGKVMSGVEAL